MSLPLKVIANRIINMYYNGSMTMYEYQPAIAAYYNGAKFFPKQLVSAIEPWTGHYEADFGIWMSAHFTRFIDKGWQYIDGACFGDGKENHSITETTNNYMTVASAETGDYSVVVTNDSATERNYTFVVSNLTKAGSIINVWESRGPDDGQSYDSNWLQKINQITPTEQNGSYTYSLTVKPFSIITLTTKEVDAKTDISSTANSEHLALPYTDDFEYTNFSTDFLDKRGNAPLYSTDQGGAFEVYKQESNNVLMQMITKENKPKDWIYRTTPNPTTSIGDDTWANYTASIDATFAQDSNSDNYLGFGVRYNCSVVDENTAEAGYFLKLYSNGSWQLKRASIALAFGKIANFDSLTSQNIIITANGRKISVSINDEIITEYIDETNVLNSGRISLWSGYSNNTFDNLSVVPIDGVDPYITRIDDHSADIIYSNGWVKNSPTSYALFNRTSTNIEYDATTQLPVNLDNSLTYSFTGTGVSIIGTSASAKLKVTIDGVVIEDGIVTPATGVRNASYILNGLETGTHTVIINVLEGQYALDAIEVNTSETLIKTGTERQLQETTDNKTSTKKDKGIFIPIIIGTLAIIATAICGTIIIKKKKIK